MARQSPTVKLACELIGRASVTPDDAGCQKLIAQRLEAAGFTVTHLPFDNVDNLWAVHGQGGPMLCFAGHTDVVPTGPLVAWQHAPFEPTIENGVLFGRGAADMKGSLAAMITAVETFADSYPEHPGQIAFLLTSDEEGIAANGTVKVVEWLSAQSMVPDWCIVGEPSSSEALGDVIKNGRRGSLGAELTVVGVQGHVAYPHLADNPIHRALAALCDLTSEVWDQGNAFFPATSLQISNIKAGTGATNVIPGELHLSFNFRYSTEVTAPVLQNRTQAILDRHDLDYTITWNHSGEPFLTAPGMLVDATVSSILEVTGLSAQLSTAGGTSDGRFIAPLGTQVIELGPVNATIHQVNECVACAELDTLSEIYQHILRKLLVEADDSTATRK